MMKIFQKLVPTLFLLLTASLLWSQSNIKKANKQYELYAFNTAIKSYLNVLERQPNNAEALGKLADCYRHLNRLQEAEKWYEKAVRQKGVDNLYVFQYAETLKGLGKYDQARSLYLKFARNYPVQGNQFAESCKFALAHIGDNPSFETKNEYLNTASSEFGPAFYNGRSVAYSSARRDIRNNRNASNVLGNQPFITQLDANGYLESPVLLKGNFGGAAAEGNISYSPDGKMVTFTKNNYVDGTRQIPSSGMELSLFFAEVTGNGDWKNEVPFPYNGSGYSTGFGSFSADGNAVYFASNRPDGFGGYDIYVSYRVGNSWSAPENLGPVVNTQGNEITPFHDGTYLFFASDWHMGFGGFDIFRSSKSDGRWAVVEHGGNGLNSSRDDYGFVYNTQLSKGFFVSNRVGGKGQEDIYGVGRSLTTGFVGMPGAISNSAGSGFSSGNTNTTSTTSSSNNNSVGTNSSANSTNTYPNGRKTLALQIFNSTDGQPVYNAVIDLSSCGEGIQKTNTQGQVFLNRGRVYECSAFISADGFGPKTINVRSYITNKKGNVPVYINKADNLYTGQVVDRLSGYLLDGVLVEASSASSLQKYRAYSTPDGKYAMPLKENTVYDIRFSKAGYRDANTTMSTGTRAGNKTLETVALSSANSINSNTGSSTTSTNTTPGTVFQQGGSSTNSSNYSDNNANNTSYGYAVQVASLSNNKVVNLGNYNAKLGKYGEIFIYEEKGRKKVRLGLYATKSEALAMQKKARALGYNGAFTVMQENGIQVPQANESTYIEDRTSAMNPGSGGYTPPPLGTGTAINGLNDLSGYVIQIGAFKNAASFNRENVLDIGVLDSFQKGNLTVFVLKGYDTREQADSALRKAKSRGFKTAFLVNK